MPDMLIISRSIRLAKSAATPAVLLDPLPPFHARLARYDRPAMDLDELLRGDGDDFVHQAYWTILDRRCTRGEHAAALDQLNAGCAKSALLLDLSRQLAADQALPAVTGLSRLLRLEQRGKLPMVGPMFVALSILVERQQWLGWPARFISSVPGKFRWGYRHSRKLLVRAGGALRLPSRVEMRRTFGVEHASPLPDMSPRAVWIYTELCVALDHSSRDD